MFEAQKQLVDEYLHSLIAVETGLVSHDSIMLTVRFL